MITYNDKPEQKPTSVSITAKSYPGGYKPLIIWYAKDQQTHQYLADGNVYETIYAALEVAHGTLMAETNGVHRLGRPKANRLSISYKIITEDKL